jgi:hypothetical protein
MIRRDGARSSLSEILRGAPAQFFPKASSKLLCQVDPGILEGFQDDHAGSPGNSKVNCTILGPVHAACCVLEFTLELDCRIRIMPLHVVFHLINRSIRLKGGDKETAF